jgi:hypothetical protein
VMISLRHGISDTIMLHIVLVCTDDLLQYFRVIFPEPLR